MSDWRDGYEIGEEVEASLFEPGVWERCRVKSRRAGGGGRRGTPGRATYLGLAWWDPAAGAWSRETYVASSGNVRRVAPPPETSAPADKERS